MDTRTRSFYGAGVAARCSHGRTVARVQQTLGGSAPSWAENSGMPGTVSSDAPNPGGGYILIRNGRASSAVDSAVEVSSDTSQQPQKTTQFASNAMQRRKLDLGSQSAFQLPKNRPQALSDPTQQGLWK